MEPDRSLLQLDLPEHARIELPLAGIGRRGAAALLDMSMMALVGLVGALGIIAAAGGRVLGGDVAFGVLSLTLGLMPIAGPLIFEMAWHGQTPGKRLMSMRVISRDGSAASRGQLLLRNVLRLVDFLPAGYFLGLVSVFITDHGQRLGDLVAGTVVIREDAAALHDSGVRAAATVPHDLYGIPEMVVRAAALLADPARDLEPRFRAQRRNELLAVARRHRPDLEREADDALWARLSGTASR